MRVIEKADVAPLEPLLCSIEAGTALIARSERAIIRPDRHWSTARRQVGSPHAAGSAIAQGIRGATARSQGHPQSA
jgi:hypothetical protein